MNGLLFSLPGTPVIYYGDEIGMGDNIYLGDRNGVRTPMQWSADRNAGFSRANPQRLYLPVDHRPRVPLRGGQRRDPAEQPELAAVVDARLIALRKRHPVFGRGDLEFLHPENRQGAGLPAHATTGRSVLVVANLSRFAQYVELDLSQFRGIGAGGAVRRRRRSRRSASCPTCSPWARTRSTGSRWRASARRRVPSPPTARRPPSPRGGALEAIATGRSRGELERALARFLPDAPVVRQQGPEHPVGVGARHAAIAGPRAALAARVLIAEVEFGEGEGETYVRPAGAGGGRARRADGDRRAAQHRGPSAGTAPSPRCWPRPCSTRTSAAPCSTRCAAAGA